MTCERGVFTRLLQVREAAAQVSETACLYRCSEALDSKRNVLPATTTAAQTLAQLVACYSARKSPRLPKA